MPAIANVSLQDTFDTWRIRTNQITVAIDQLLTVTTDLTKNVSDTFNVSVITANNNANTARAYANNMGNTSNLVARVWANNIGVQSNTYAMIYANNIGNSVNTFANASFATIANAAAAFDAANSKVASVSGTSGRIANSGTTSVTLDLATTGNGAVTYTTGISSIQVDAYGRVVNVSGNADYQANLMFTPVQQGGGTGQGTNKLRVGWGGSKLFLQVDSTNYANTWPIDISGTALTTNQTTWPLLYTTTQLNAQGSQPSSLLTATGSLGAIMVQNPGGVTAAFMSFYRVGAYAAYFGLDTDNQFAVGGWSAGTGLASMKVGSFGVGTAASGSLGEIRATNNITAYYSDKRLKENIKKIDNALDKVTQISGITFTNNDTAASYGYADKSIQVGVIAQEIQNVLPMAVKHAPFDIETKDGVEVSKSGEYYLTVQYEKLVPLLIEAIKELKAEVEELKRVK